MPAFTETSSATAWQVINAMAKNAGDLKDNWCVPPEAGRFLYLLTRIQKASRILEVGTSIGFSTLHLALGIVENGSATSPKLITIDASSERQAIARENSSKANLAGIIDFRVGDALETLKSLGQEPVNQGSVDLAFIDARKEEYLAYTGLIFPMLRPGGLLAADNTQSHRDSMKDFVQSLLEKDRALPEAERQWDSCEVETASGLIMAMKRA